jgi:ATP-dependent DNA ligase
VVKRKDSTYLEGKEPGTWLKYRLYEIDEFVMGGYLKRKDPFFDPSSSASARVIA